MTLQTTTSIFLLLSFVSSTYAQYYDTNYHRPLASRIIAGIVVAVAAVVIFGLICCTLVRRRRRAAQNASYIGPTTGGPFGKPQGVPPVEPMGAPAYNTGPAQEAGYSGYNQQNPGAFGYGGAQYPPGKPYAPVNDDVPPPSYPGKDGSENPYGPPPGAPPQAHTTGDNGHFVGGFRQNF